MTQPSERVFFNDNGIFMSDRRFVTHDGSVVPTMSIQRVWGSVDKDDRGGCLGFLTGLLGFAGLVMMAVGGIVIAAGHGGQPGFSLVWGYGLLGLGLPTAIVGFIFCGLISKLLPRRRYWANFTFAGGGVFSGGGSVSRYGRISTSSVRVADYSAWSYDEDWTRNLIAAANEAMLASGA
ncbi:MAG: hypothetical protein OXM01_08790 [Gemmatimonadota bacterium]|nr:hypothetical protein [Gemmatimonadota bacterium]